MNYKWCEDAAKQIKPRLSTREQDWTRSDDTFRENYMMPRTRAQFVFPENALRLNERLTIQQGSFLCPGDVTATFETNLKSMQGCGQKKNVVKLRLDMKKEQFCKFARMLRRMNVSSAALYPGLDGFARSIGEQVLHYQYFARNRIGQELRGVLIT